MSQLKNLLLASIFMFAGSLAIAQGKVVGKIIDGDSGDPLPGANVVLKGTNYGTASDFDGNFSFQAPAGDYTLLISYVGYSDKTLAVQVSEGKTLNLGTIKLQPSAESLGQVVIVGVADIAKERETPVAQSTLKAIEIQENIGSKELPEVLNYTPSVYATKQGGGWGDSRINVRGFDQRNTAVLINGMPVNDMENGWVYWSNWAGLADVVSAMQVQRGLGSSKLAISSVGGTINILTTTSEKRKGGSIGFSLGNDGYTKLLASYSTGLMENGFSASFLLSHTKGEGYVDATQFNGYTWFLGLGYKPSDRLSFMFTATGAPQWHHQRDWEPALKDYIAYGGTFDKPNIKYNSDWGYLNGEVFSWRRNFYHKPIASLNIDFDINDHSKINTVVYGSWGRGGGTGGIGKINGKNYYYGTFRDTQTGLVRFDDIYTWNSGGSVPDFGADRVPDADGLYTNTRNEGISRRASMNSHDWYGAIANYHNDFSENLSFDLGFDWRTYKGYHYRVVNNILGADRYLDNRDRNNPNRYIYPEDYVEAVPAWNPFIDITGQQKIEYYNVGRVKWIGGFTQLEYKTEKLSTFVQAGISQQGFKRIDYFNLPRDVDGDGVDEPQESDWVNLLGGNIKTGANYNIDEHNNVFLNAGYYSKQPLFRAVFPNYTDNRTTPDLRNEQVQAVEAGYGYRDNNWNVKLNVYYTLWKDRFAQVSDNFDHDNDPNTPDIRGFARLYGIKEVHKGIELESNARMGKFRLFGTISVGNWYYLDDVSAPFVDENNDPIPGVGNVTLYLKDVKVGDAAQFTTRFGVKYYLLDNLSISLNQFYADNLYADFNAVSFQDPNGRNEALKLPSYSLVDAGINYNVKIKDFGKLYFGLNVDNLFNKIYISESATNYFPGDRGNNVTWNGINTSNRVFFGWGRTWRFNVKFKF